MKGKTVGFSDEVKAPSKTAEEAGHMKTEASERFATGTNSTTRYKSKSKPYGKLGNKGMPG